jgi:hypothetical protein
MKRLRKAYLRAKVYVLYRWYNEYHQMEPDEVFVTVMQKLLAREICVRYREDIIDMEREYRLIYDNRGYSVTLSYSNLVRADCTLALILLRKMCDIIVDNDLR